MDCGWSVTRDGNQGTVMIKIVKDSEEGANWTFSLHPMEIGETKAGQPITACSVNIDRMPSSEPISKPTSNRGIPKSAQTALRALREAIDEVGAVPPASNHIPPKVKTVTVKQWRQYAYSRGISNSTEDRARQQAFKRGYEHLIGTEHAKVWEGQVWPIG
jgi:hypothetical protein